MSRREVEVKPSEATICGFVPLVEARRSFMDGFMREARSKNNCLAQLHVKLPKKLYQTGSEYPYLY